MPVFSLLAALCAGISCGCVVCFLGRRISEVGVEKKRDFGEKRVPLVFRLVLPFAGVTRRIASSAGAAPWRKSEQVRLNMAGYADVFTPEDFIAIRLLFCVISGYVSFKYSQIIAEIVRFNNSSLGCGECRGIKIAVV